MKIYLSTLVLFSYFLMMPCTSAASFSCVNAQTKTEHRVCENLLLNDADVKMTTTYNIVRRLVPMGTRSEIQTEQVKWLDLRNQCLDNLNCLKNVYQMRQQKLDLHMNRIYRMGPF